MFIVGRVANPKQRAMTTSTHTGIVYQCPNVVEPFGGVRLILRHVAILNRNGIPGYTYVAPGEQLSNWLKGEQAPIVRAIPTGRVVRVIPETDVEALRQFSRKVILVQSFGFLSPFTTKIEREDDQIEGVITVSHPLASAVKQSFGRSATVISPSIDTAMFKPAAKDHLIAFMTRRNWIGIEEILALAKPSSFGIDRIQGLTHAEVACRLSRASIFLAAGYSEGFGLPSLEAMASGCLVVGFAGGGGLEFMEDGVNCLLAEDGNSEEAAEKLKLAMRLVSENRHRDLVENAIQTARKFSPEREEKELLAFWTEFLARGGSHSPIAEVRA